MFPGQGSEVRWVWNDYSLQSLLGDSMPICTQKTPRSPCIATCSNLFKPTFPTFTGAQTHFSWSTYYHAPELVVQETHGGENSPSPTPAPPRWGEESFGGSPCWPRRPCPPPGPDAEELLPSFHCTRACSSAPSPRTVRSAQLLPITKCSQLTFGRFACVPLKFTS